MNRLTVALFEVFLDDVMPVWKQLWDAAEAAREEGTLDARSKAAACAHELFDLLDDWSKLGDEDQPWRQPLEWPLWGAAVRYSWLTRLMRLQELSPAEGSKLVVAALALGVVS